MNAEKVIQDAVEQLRKDALEDDSPTSASASAFERLQKLFATSAEINAVDFAYEHLMKAVMLLIDDHGAFGQCVELMKRALIRYAPSSDELGRINDWCDQVIPQIDPKRANANAGKDGEAQTLVNSLKFLKRLVQRQMTTWKERHLARGRGSLSDQPDANEGSVGNEGQGQPLASGASNSGRGDQKGDGSPQARGVFPHSALRQLHANCDTQRQRRGSSLEFLRQTQSADCDSIPGTTRVDAFSKPEHEQNLSFKNLLENRTKSITELSDDVKLVLAYIMDMYEKDPQQTFVIVSIFLQEMLMEHTSVIQKRAFDVFLNFVFHWQQHSLSKHPAKPDGGGHGIASTFELDVFQQNVNTALASQDGMWSVSLLNEMCLVLLECGKGVDPSIWRHAHACATFCCAKNGELVPKLVKLISFEVLQKFLDSAMNCPWSRDVEGIVVTMLVSHILPYRGHHLGVDSYSFQLLGGIAGIIDLMRKSRSEVSHQNLFVLAFYYVLYKLNGPYFTLSGERMVQSNIALMEALIATGFPISLAQCFTSQRSPAPVPASDSDCCRLLEALWSKTLQEDDHHNAVESLPPSPSPSSPSAAAFPDKHKILKELFRQFTSQLSPSATPQ